MEEFVKVAAVTDIPDGKTKGFVVAGHKLLVANVGGKFYAVSSLCTHVGGPLDKGPLEKTVVTCPWHGSKFDVTTGALVNGPAEKVLDKFEVKLEGTDILVKV